MTANGWFTPHIPAGLPHDVAREVVIRRADPASPGPAGPPEGHRPGDTGNEVSGPDPAAALARLERELYGDPGSVIRERRELYERHRLATTDPRVSLAWVCEQLRLHGHHAAATLLDTIGRP